MLFISRLVWNSPHASGTVHTHRIRSFLPDFLSGWIHPHVSLQHSAHSPPKRLNQVAVVVVLHVLVSARPCASAEQGVLVCRSRCAARTQKCSLNKHTFVEGLLHGPPVKNLCFSLWWHVDRSVFALPLTQTLICDQVPRTNRMQSESSQNLGGHTISISEVPCYNVSDPWR